MDLISYVGTEFRQKTKCFLFETTVLKISRLFQRRIHTCTVVQNGMIQQHMSSNGIRIRKTQDHLKKFITWKFPFIFYILMKTENVWQILQM